MKGQSLGLIETWGLTAALEAADAACKAAVVALLGCQRVGAGLVTVQLTGDVAAVKAAVHAGAAAASRVGRVVAAHVIARPDRQLRVGPAAPHGCAPQPQGAPAGGGPPGPASPAAGKKTAGERPPVPEAATAEPESAIPGKAGRSRPLKPKTGTPAGAIKGRKKKP